MVSGGQAIAVMDPTPALLWLEHTSIATTIRDSLLLFPLLESAHVLGLALVVGTITVIDLRLLGLASTNRPFQRLASDIMKWTWGAFALTAAAGLLMFTTNAHVYFNNFYFRLKMGLLVAAALNVLVFQFTVYRRVDRWNEAPAAPRAGKIVAVVSLAIWVAAVFAGRMIGFTTTRTSITEPAPADVNFEELLGLPADSNSQPPASEPAK
jgi:hypothetical protein